MLIVQCLHILQHQVSFSKFNSIGLNIIFVAVNLNALTFYMHIERKNVEIFSENAFWNYNICRCKYFGCVIVYIVRYLLKKTQFDFVL